MRRVHQCYFSDSLAKMWLSRYGKYRHPTETKKSDAMEEVSGCKDTPGLA